MYLFLWFYWQKIKGGLFFFYELFLFYKRGSIWFESKLNCFPITDESDWCFYFEILPHECVHACASWAWRLEAAAEELLCEHIQLCGWEQWGFQLITGRSSLTFTSVLVFVFNNSKKKQTLTFMELIIFPIMIPGWKHLKRIWNEALQSLVRRADWGGFFYLRSERWKFCCWSSCVCRRGRTRWVPEILTYTHKEC